MYCYGGGKKRETATRAIQNQFNHRNGLVQANLNDRASFKGYK